MNTLLKVSFIMLSGFAVNAVGDTVENLTTFSSGEVISSSAMNQNFQEIKKAVDGNDSQIADLSAQVEVLSQADTCAGNNPQDVMVRVGTICVDKYKASLWATSDEGATEVSVLPAECAANGLDCSGIVAQSREQSSAAISGSISYARAQAACINAGKRLLTPGEWLMAATSADTSGMLTVDSMEFVLGVKETAVTGEKLVVGYIGPRSAAKGEIQFVANIKFDDPSTGNPWLGFRCAR